jgi:hypothetical protein
MVGRRDSRHGDSDMSSLIQLNMHGRFTAAKLRKNLLSAAWYFNTVCYASHLASFAVHLLPIQFIARAI